MINNQPQHHYEQCYIRHLDGHAEDDDGAEPEDAFYLPKNMSFAEYEIMIRR